VTEAPTRLLGNARPAGRTIRWMAGPARTSRPAEFLPRRGRAAALGVLAVFVAIGVVQHTQPNTSLVVLAVVVAIGASALTLEARLPLLLAYAAVAAAGVVILCNRASSNCGWFAICLLCGWCVLAGGWRIGLVYWLGAIAVFASEALWADPDPGWIAWMAGTTFTALGCLLIRRERDLVAKLRAAQAGLADRARAEERNRIARELHDVIAHTLIISQLHVASARLAVETDPADAARALAEAERLGRESLAEVRRAVGLLREDSADGRAAPLPGVADVPVLIERFRSAGAGVTLTVDGDAGALPGTTGLAVYRILQEALTNAIKHAPGSPVVVALTVEGAHARLTVDSAGPPGRGTGLGVPSMQERARALGGTCEAGPGGRGWLVRADFPLGEAA
jgi:signal transduction histidine kinase